MSVQSLIDAINRRQVLHMNYDGHDRVVEPHCIGIGTSGNELLRCYQTEGGSNSGEPVNWKLMIVGKIQNLRSTTETFPGPRPGYKQGDKAMSSIQAQL